MKIIMIHNATIGFHVISNYGNITSLYSSARFRNALKKVLPTEFIDNQNASIDINEGSDLFELVINAIEKEKSDCEKDNSFFGVRGYHQWYYDL